MPLQTEVHAWLDEAQRAHFLIWRNGRVSMEASFESMRQPSPSSSSPPHQRADLPETCSSAACLGTWRVLWAAPAIIAVLAQPSSPGKWPALALLVASAFVLHADAFARSIRRLPVSRRPDSGTEER